MTQPDGNGTPPMHDAEAIAAALATGAALRHDAEGWWIANWEEWTTSYASEADAARAFLDWDNEEMVAWDGTGPCPKCQGDDCSPESGCRYD